MDNQAENITAVSYEVFPKMQLIYKGVWNAACKMNFSI